MSKGKNIKLPIASHCCTYASAFSSITLDSTLIIEDLAILLSASSRSADAVIHASIFTHRALLTHHSRAFHRKVKITAPKLQVVTHLVAAPITFNTTVISLTTSSIKGYSFTTLLKKDVSTRCTEAAVV